jgi:hypothetical protein
MKKLISLFLVVAMMSSFAMIVNAETKVTFNVDWYSAEYDDEAEDYAGSSTKITEATAGDYIAAKVSVPKNTYLACAGFYITYDPSILEVYMFEDKGAELSESPIGTIKGGITYGTPASAKKTFVSIIFTVKENPTKTLDNLISLAIDDAGKNAYNPGGGAEAFFTGAETAVDVADLTIDGLIEGGSKEFTVTADDNGVDTVVTVANKGDKTGLVYAASYDANDVLVNCAPAQALADGTLTFTGITGNVKVFVWDANNAPLLDAFVAAE